MDDWEKLLATQKVHDQVGILLSDKEELQSEPSTDPVGSDDNYALVDGKRIKVGRIFATLLKRPKPPLPRPQFGHRSAK